MPDHNWRAQTPGVMFRQLTPPEHLIRLNEHHVRYLLKTCMHTVILPILLCNLDSVPQKPGNAQLLWPNLEHHVTQGVLEAPRTGLTQQVQKHHGLDLP